MSSIVQLLITVSVARFLQAAATDLGMLKRIRGCLSHDGPVVCLKERALDVLNETIMSDKPMSLYGIVDVVKDPGYKPSADVEDLPRDLASRNVKLNEMIYDKVEEFFASRSLSLNLGNIIEGRGKKDKKGGMLMMGGLAMAGMMAQMFMGKIAFMAGAALLVAKLALLLSTIIGFKKLSGGSGGGGGGLQGPFIGLGVFMVAVIQAFISVTALVKTVLLLLSKKAILIGGLYGFGKLTKTMKKKKRKPKLA